MYCAWRIPAHQRCTQYSIMLHLMDICFLTCICLWQISQIQTRLFKVGLVSTSLAFVSKLLLQPDHHLRRRVKNPPNPLRQSNRVHLLMNLIQTNTGKSKESSLSQVYISKFNNSNFCIAESEIYDGRETWNSEDRAPDTPKGKSLGILPEFDRGERCPRPRFHNLFIDS